MAILSSLITDPLGPLLPPAAAGVLPLAVITAPPERYEFRQTHMGTLVRIVLCAPTREAAEQASNEAFRLIARLDQSFSDYREESDLTLFGLRAGTGQVAVSEDLFAILTLSQLWSERTGGIFDVTAAPLIRLWKRARRTRELPDPARLAEARRLTDYRRLRLDPRQRSASLELTGMRLDLGGIAKGYAADLAVDLLARQGITRTLVALGGDIVVGDAPPGTDGWEVGVAPLDNPNRPPTVCLRLRHSAVSTSGDVEQSVTIGGVRYSHIVDPRTGRGVTGHSATTVVARHGATSDVLATTLSILGSAEGLKLIDRLSGVDPSLAVLFSEQERVTTSPRWVASLCR